MPRPALRTLCTAMGAAIVLQATPGLAASESSRDFTRRTVPKAADFPASRGSFQPSPVVVERSGPADVVANMRGPDWRLCRDCGYDTETPKQFKAVGLRASFQPIGGTFSYRF